MPLAVLIALLSDSVCSLETKRQAVVEVLFYFSEIVHLSLTPDPNLA